MSKVLVVAILSSLLFACGGGDADRPETPASVASIEVPGLTEQSVAVGSVTVQVEKGGGVAQLGDGARVEVAAGALPAGTTVTFGSSELVLTSLNLSMDDPIVYSVTVSPDASVTGGVVLRIPGAPQSQRVLELVGTEWKPVATTGTDSTEIAIDHFSSRIWAAVKAAKEAVFGETVPPDWEAQHRTAVERADKATQQFYGVGEVTTRSHADTCAEFKTVLAKHAAELKDLGNKRPGDVPGDNPVRVQVVIGGFLKQADAPSLKRGGIDPYYWNKVESAVNALRSRVNTSSQPVSPAQLLEMSLAVNNGDVYLAVLTAHNLLKDVAYQGRLQGDPAPEGPWQPGQSVRVSTDSGTLAAHLATWRTGTPWSPKGRYDKMGPLYHLFATMTARLWGGAILGQAALQGEAFLRAAGIGSDSVDPDEGAADQCGYDIGGWLLNPTAAPAAVTCPSQVLEKGKSYAVTLETSRGNIVVHLLSDSAPQTANSFACLAASGFFDNQTFYRVDPKFVIVSGDPTKSGDGDAGYSTPLEASTVRNRRGTLSVGARPSGTVGSQFFINVVDNKHLDFDNPRADKYYPFAEVTSGLDVVDAIAAGAPGAVSILHATLKPE